MTEYKELGQAIKGDRIFAQARRIEKPYLTIEHKVGEAILFKNTKLIQSAYCVIEKPLIGNNI